MASRDAPAELRCPLDDGDVNNTPLSPPPPLPPASPSPAGVIASPRSGMTQDGRVGGAMGVYAVICGGKPKLGLPPTTFGALLLSSPLVSPLILTMPRDSACFGGDAASGDMASGIEETLEGADGPGEKVVTLFDR